MGGLRLLVEVGDDGLRLLVFSHGVLIFGHGILVGVVFGRLRLLGG